MSLSYKFLLFLVFGCGGMGAVSLWSNMLPFSSFSPYIGGENQWCIRFETKAVRVVPLLGLYETTFLYSPTSEASVDIAIPLWSWQGADVVLGDLTVDFRGVAFRSEGMQWRGVFLFGIRLPTGVSPEGGVRRIDDRVLQYFPYSTGALGWRGGMILSYMGWPIWFHTTWVYVSEYRSDETLFDIDGRDDGVMIQLMGDYLIRFGSFRLLLSGGLFSWICWGSSPWPMGVWGWQKSTFFWQKWRFGYEIAYGQDGMGGLFVQYNF